MSAQPPPQVAEDENRIRLDIVV